MSRKIVGTFLGFTIGFFILHPLSMVFQGMIHPDVSIRPDLLIEAFNEHHISMALFFGTLGALFGFMNISYTLSVSRGKKRIRMLESLLPICSYCKKIRDDSDTGKGKGQWIRIDHYISSKTDTTFTHGMCTECYEIAMEKLDNEDKYMGRHPHKQAET